MARSGNHNPVRQFSKDYQPSNEAKRKPKRKPTWKIFMENLNLEYDGKELLSENDYNDIFALLSSMNKEQIGELIKNPNIPLAVVCYIKAIKTDLESGETKTLDKIIERRFGKPNVKAEVNSNVSVTKIDVKNLTDDELAVLEKLADEELNRNE